MSRFTPARWFAYGGALAMTVGTWFAWASGYFVTVDGVDTTDGRWVGWLGVIAIFAIAWFSESALALGVAAVAAAVGAVITFHVAYGLGQLTGGGLWVSFFGALAALGGVAMVAVDRHA